jgi:hypothetical protein
MVDALVAHSSARSWDDTVRVLRPPVHLSSPLSYAIHNKSVPNRFVDSMLMEVANGSGLMLVQEMEEEGLVVNLPVVDGDTVTVSNVVRNRAEWCSNALL